MKGLTFQGAQDVRVEEVADPTIESPDRRDRAGHHGRHLRLRPAHLQRGRGLRLPGGQPPRPRVHRDRRGRRPRGARGGAGRPGHVVVLGGLRRVHLVPGGARVVVRPLVAVRLGPARLAARRRGEGGQSEFVRVPLADSTLHPMPEALAGHRPRGDPAAAGRRDVHRLARPHLGRRGPRPVGRRDRRRGRRPRRGPRRAAKGAERIVALGHHADRLATATELGATLTVDSRDVDEIKQLVMEHTGGEGAHVVVDSISSPGSMATAHACVRPGGTIACLGMDHFMGSTPSDQLVRPVPAQHLGHRRPGAGPALPARAARRWWSRASSTRRRCSATASRSPRRPRATS